MIGLLAALTLAGGGPANVLVLYSSDDAGSAAIAMHYADARSIPAPQLCGLGGLDPTMLALPFAAYEASIRLPFEACLAAAPQPDDLDYVVVVRGLPIRVDLDGGGPVSLTSLLAVHRAARDDGTELAGAPQKATEGVLAPGVPNPVYQQVPVADGAYALTNPSAAWYASSLRIVKAAEQPASFRRRSAGHAGGYGFDGNLFVVTRLDGFDDDDAHALIDRAVAGDGKYPSAELLCMAGADEARAARDPECEYATRHLALAGYTASYLAPHDPSLSGRTVAAYFTGAADLHGAIDGLTYVPGALVDNLTSLGAVPENFVCANGACPSAEQQTSIARLVRAGATGVHGAVAEPLNSCFPNAGALLLYTFGYGMGESVLFAERFLYWQNLLVGDPLAAPWATRPKVTLVAADLQVSVSATHPDGVAGLALYADGVRVATSDGAPIAWTAPSYDTHLLAVATAKNALALREGWPNPAQRPRPDVQGWATVTLNAPVPEPPAEPTPDVGADVAPAAPLAASGGCATSGRSASWLALLLLALTGIAPTIRGRRIDPRAGTASR